MGLDLGASLLTPILHWRSVGHHALKKETDFPFFVKGGPDNYKLSVLARLQQIVCPQAAPLLWKKPEEVCHYHKIHSLWQQYVLLLSIVVNSRSFSQSVNVEIDGTWAPHANKSWDCCCSTTTLVLWSWSQKWEMLSHCHRALIIEENDSSHLWLIAFAGPVLSICHITFLHSFLDTL